MEMLWLEEVGSTNSYLKEHVAEIDPMTMVCARRQTAGRGQRGNIWEAEPGMNLTLSFYFKPAGVRPAEQFAVSEAVALAVGATLKDFGIETRVKWPNDIYVGESKICGILIENSLQGDEISRSIVGIGLNVNQRKFHSDAPNPVSMAEIVGHSFVLDDVAISLGRHLEEMIAVGKEALHGEYLRWLWRGDGKFYPFRDVASGVEFSAAIHSVLPSGLLVLRPETVNADSAGAKAGDSDDGLVKYSFKEVVFLKNFD